MAFFLLLVPIQAQAQGTDFAETHHYTLKYRQQIDDYLAGRLDMSVRYNSERIKYICGYIQSDFAATEMGKLKYNDQFGEVQNEEQAQDIQHLNDALAKETDCKKRFRIWVAYDDKWYYQKRKMQDAKNKEQEKIWASQVVDTGADVWDGVINGTFFAIPRKYMWAGRNKADGLEIGINLLFLLPVEGGDVDIPVVLGNGSIITKRCYGYEREMCTRSTVQIWRWGAHYLDCNNKLPLSEANTAIWRRKCSFQEEGQPVEPPVFDSQVGMWKIGTAGYYEGEPEFPDYWMVCGKPGTAWKSNVVAPRCQSAVQIDERTFAYYSFPQKTGFWHHREVHKLVTEQIRSFIVNNKSEE